MSRTLLGRVTRVRCVWGGLMAVGLVPHVGWAAPPRLDYAADLSCPDQNRFSDEVSARIGKRAFAEEGVESVLVRLDVVEDGVRGVLTTPQGVRVATALECERVFSELVTAAAFALDDDPVLVPEATIPPALIRVEFSKPSLRKTRVSRVTSYGLGRGWTLLGPVEVTTVNLRDVCTGSVCEFSLPPGDHELVAAASGRVPVRQTFSFGPAEEVVLAARLPRPVGRSVGAGLATLGAFGIATGYILAINDATGGARQNRLRGPGLVVVGGLTSLAAIPIYLSSRGRLSRKASKRQGR